MAALQIFLLGGFRILDDESPLSGFESPRLQALIARLVLNSGVPQPRQQLAFMFWPDSTETQARTNLRQLLHAFRRALPDYEQYVSDQGSSITWRDDVPFFLDVHQFRAGVQRGRSVQDLAAVIDLYRGDLLPNNYDDALVPERERLRAEFSDLIERAINQAEADGDINSALTFVQRLIEHDPLREEVYRSLMRLSAMRGERAGVIRAYRACVATWERELGVEPSQETRELYERLRSETALATSSSIRDASPVTSSEPPVTRSWLPAPMTPLIGRERETGAIEALLDESTVRLVTLTGVGGIGKTRIALQVAEDLLQRFADGVWFVDLATIATPDLVMPTVARVLGLRQADTQPALDIVKAFTADKQLLLVLDNVEQIREAAPDIAALLISAPGLRVLATSRAPLRIQGEREYPIPPLELPADHDVVDLVKNPMQAEAVRLFVERARAVHPTFRLSESTAATVVSICRRLDGLPLAIELAAARIRSLSPDELLGRLDRSLDILTSGWRDLPSRQQTLRRTIDWSYRSLNLVEQTLFARLAVFSGGCTLEAIESVSAVSDARDEHAVDVLDGIDSLVENSLLQRDTLAKGSIVRGQPRFRMLETIHQYASERLAESKQADIIRSRHAGYYTTLAEREELALWGGPEQVTSLERLDAEYDNLRTALAWALSGGESVLGLRLASSLGQYWFIRGQFAEGREWLRLALAVAPVGPLRAIVLNHLGGIAIQQGLQAHAEPLLQESLTIFRALDDDRWTALTLFRLGQAQRFLGQWEQAIANFEECLAAPASVDNSMRSVRGLALVHLGVLLMEHGDAARGEDLLNEALLIGRRLNDDVAVGSALVGLGWAAHYAGHGEQAASLMEDAFTVFRSLRHYSGSSDALVGLGWIDLARGKTGQARQWLRECLRVAYERGGMAHVADSLAALGAVAGSQGRIVEDDAALRAAARLFGAAERLRETAGPSFFPSSTIREQSIALARTRLDPARWAAAWESGRALTTAEAVALASIDPLT